MYYLWPQKNAHFFRIDKRHHQCHLLCSLRFRLIVGSVDQQRRRGNKKHLFGWFGIRRKTRRTRCTTSYILLSTPKNSKRLAQRPNGRFDPSNVVRHLGVHAGNVLVAAIFAKRRDAVLRVDTRPVDVGRHQRTTGIALQWKTKEKKT